MSEGRTYVLLLHGDESVWASIPDDERAAPYAAHGRFVEACAEAGHTVLGGHELAPAASSLVVRRSGDEVSVTDGPFLEVVEQLGGYYVIRTSDVDGLAQLASALVADEGTVEIRPVVASQ
jgi:hypothetical protein